MKRLMGLALVFFCPLSFLTVSNAQTSPNKSQLFPYDDADGYQVLSSIIDASTNKLKSESVSIFHHTISEEAFRGIRFQCSGSIPAEFQSAAEDLDKKAKTKFLLQQEFSIQKKYKLVALSRETPVNVGNQSQTASSSAMFSVSAVGFDETKAHAIALVRYIVHNGGTTGGSSTFHLLRKTAQGWQEAMEIPKCGRIY
jgi:hypothetical protein